MARTLFIALALSLIAGFCLTGWAGSELVAKTAAAPAPTACPKTLGSNNGLVCRCSAAQVKAAAPVWGDEVYSDDSAICRAALHAGAIGAKGGVIFVEEDFGRSSYPAATRNGVKSLAKGGWQRSIGFSPVATADLPANAPQAMAAPSTYIEGELNIPQGNASEGKCPASAVGYKLGATHSCSCDEAASNGNATVWGINPYSANSNICLAARHSSVIGGGGGTISFLMVNAPDFKASSKRSVSTQARAGGLGFVF